MQSRSAAFATSSPDVRAAIARVAATGRVTECLELLRRIDTLTPQEKVLQCELEALAGNGERAFEQARSLLSKESAPDVTVRALLVTAREALATGLGDGNSQFQRALSIATEVGTPALVALVLGRHIEALLALAGLGPAGAYLAAYRRAALRAGDASSLQTLHHVLAETELKSGRTIRASSELQLAEFHAPDSPNILVQARHALAKGLVLADLGDIRAAYQHCLGAALLASSSGALSLLGPALSTLAHLQVVLGLHEEARSTISQLTAQRARSVSSELARRSSHFMLANALRDSVMAAMLDREFGQLGETGTMISAHWFNLERVHYLVNENRAAEATSLGLKSIEKLSASSDLSLLERLRVATAQAMTAAGRSGLAADLIESVLMGPTARLPEFLASVFAVSGLVASDSPATALDHFARAERIYGHIGHIVGRGETLHRAAVLRATLDVPSRSTDDVAHVTAFYSEPPRIFGRVDAHEPLTSPVDAASHAVLAASALVDLASRPALCGYELLLLVSATGAAEASVLVTKGNNSVDVIGWTGTAEPDVALVRRTEQLVSISLGSDGG